MIYDSCYFLNELDLLEIRFETLDRYVDKFVVVECNQTFSGKQKPFLIQENWKRYEKWHHKIIYYPFSNPLKSEDLVAVALKSPCVGNGEDFWVREFVIKESLKDALSDCKDDDIIFVSDLDEFWNFNHGFYPRENEVLKPRQLPYLYFFNQRTDEDWLGWSGTICTRYKTIKHGILNHLRDDNLQEFSVIENGGWHFNSIGGKSKKQLAADHPLVWSKGDWDRREVNMRKDESQLPREILKLRNKYPDYFLD